MQVKTVARLEKAGVGSGIVTTYLITKAPQLLLEHVVSSVQSLKLLR
jgi:hypothetical protein